MKKILSAVAFATFGLSASSFAQGPQGPEGGQKPNFEQHKAQAVQRITEHLNCVKAAKNHEDMQACRPQRPEGGQRQEGAMQRPPMQDGAHGQGQRPMPGQGGPGQDGQRKPPMPQGPGQKPG